MQTAVNVGGTVKLGGDIALDAGLNVNADTPVVIDLNGHTVTGNGKSVGLLSGSCTIRGGSIIVEDEAAVNNFGGNLTIDRCTLSSSNATLCNCGSSAVTTVKNSTLIRNPDSEYVVFCDGGTVFLEGTVNLSGIIYGNLTVLPGTYNFDPTSYAGSYAVTDNGDGTWTVHSIIIDGDED